MKKKFEFVSYSGKYPNLCSGTLILKDEDGVMYTFKPYADYIPEKNQYPGFWTSGGSICRNVDWDMWAETGPWEFNDFCINDIDLILDNKDELIDIFNANVPSGCCGGCI